MQLALKCGVSFMRSMESPKGFTEKVHECEHEWCTAGANG